MFGNLKCCCQMTHNIRLCSFCNKNLGQFLAIVGSQTRDYSRHDKGSCCKDIAQTEGRKVEPWPKSDPPPPAWRCECPRDPQPPNYDPYRIKVPDVVVPPLPTSNAKELPNEDGRDLFKSTEINFNMNPFQGSMHDLFHNSPIVHPDYWKDKPEKKLPEIVRENLPKLGYHGRTKYKYAFHEPWKPLDRLALLSQAEKEELGPIQDVPLTETPRL